MGGVLGIAGDADREGSVEEDEADDEEEEEEADDEAEDAASRGVCLFGVGVSKVDDAGEANAADEEDEEDDEDVEDSEACIWNTRGVFVIGAWGVVLVADVVDDEADDEVDDAEDGWIAGRAGSGGTCMVACSGEETVDVEVEDDDEAGEVPDDRLMGVGDR